MSLFRTNKAFLLVVAVTYKSERLWDGGIKALIELSA